MTTANQFWLGLNKLYTRVGENDSWEKSNWLPYVEQEQGRFTYRGFTQKVGHGKTSKQKAMEADALCRLFDKYQTDSPVLYMPPSQLVGLIDLIPLLGQNGVTILTALLDSCLLDSQQIMPVEGNIISGWYITDWDSTQNGVLRSAANTLAPPLTHLATPVLLRVPYQQTDYALLGQYDPDNGILLAKAQITPGEWGWGNKDFSLGLAWVWGWGKMLWQWALPPQPLPADAYDSNLPLELRKTGKLELRLYRGTKEMATYTLQAPVMQYPLIGEEPDATE